MARMPYPIPSDVELIRYFQCAKCKVRFLTRCEHRKHEIPGVCRDTGLGSLFVADPVDTPPPAKQMIGRRL